MMMMKIIIITCRYDEDEDDSDNEDDNDNRSDNYYGTDCDDNKAKKKCFVCSFMKNQ